MLIPDSLRQEHMPMMVYALCRAVKNGKYSEDDLIKTLAASNRIYDEKSIGQAGTVLTFARNAHFVDVKNGVVATDFDEEELFTPSKFSSALLKRLDLDSSKSFATMLKWYLWKGISIEAFDNHKAIRQEMLEDAKLKQMNVSEDQTHGFLFWLEFLGIATHSYQAMGCYNYSIENILIEYIATNNKELKKHGDMPMQEFLTILGSDICFIQLCYENTNVCSALSIALRIIERMGIIEIVDKNDGSMTWHLEKSNTFRVGNSFTNIKVR
jgi:hypothetical protein